MREHEREKKCLRVGTRTQGRHGFAPHAEQVTKKHTNYISKTNSDLDSSITTNHTNHISKTKVSDLDSSTGGGRRPLSVIFIFI